MTQIDSDKDADVLGAELEDREQLRAKLKERDKELTCLYDIATLVERSGVTLDELFNGIVLLIPPAWQFPEITEARIALEQRTFQTPRFRETAWMQTREIVVNGDPVGHIQVCYLEERPASSEGPFLREERRLLNLIAERVGRITERKRAEEALRESEENFRSLAESATDYIMRYDRQCRHTYMNAAGLRVSGMEAADLIGKTHRESGFPEDLCHLWEERIMRVFETAEPCQIDFEWTGANGVVVLDMRLAPEFDGNGKVLSVLAVSRDITERRQAEQDLTQSRDLLANLTRLVPGVVYQYRLYPDGRSAFPYSSPGMNDIYEVTPEEVREDATPVFGRLHPDDSARVGEAIQESSRTLQEFYCEFRVVLPRQGLRWRWSQAHPERTSDGGTLWHGIISDITDRKRAEEAATRERTLSDAIIESIPGTFYMLDECGRYVRWNAYQRDEIVGMPEELVASTNAADTIHPDDRAFIQGKIASVLGSGVEETVEGRVLLRGGPAFRWLLMTGKRAVVDGRPFLIGTGIDITSRKRDEEERAKLEAQLHQAQKMESVGRLAGGVAHDFNNMLGVILGHAEMALEETGPSQPLHDDLVEIKTAAERSANLTRQLLAFARKQTVAPKVLDINETVESMLKMLRRLIGENIDLVWLPDAGLWPVKVDPSQIDQILANLCVNARDAVTGVGKLSIETGNSTFDEDYCAVHAEVAPGEYVRLAVSDDGCGMDKATQEKLFEPFFTTKEMGKGTGLGLATVYGVVKQNGGFINVYSEPGQGTTFTIYLPRHVVKTEHARSESPAAPEVRGHETVLLVEDEPAILKMTTRMLERQGYTVLGASTPGEAIRVAGEHAGEIHLLMTDVVMPEMNGRDLAKQLLTVYPGMKRLFMSGYTSDIIAHHGVLDEGVSFLQKPFSPQELAAKVREALERG